MAAIALGLIDSIRLCAPTPAAERLIQWSQRRTLSCFIGGYCRFEIMRHIISILMANEAGALVRVAGMFSQRGFNIETLNVAPTENPSVSRLTLVTEGTEHVVVQITRQLLKLVDVVEVRNMTGDAYLERELALLKVRANGEPATQQTSEVARIADQHGAEMVSLDEGVHTLQFVGTAGQLDALIADLVAAGRLEEEVRSGVLAMTLGAGKLHYVEDYEELDAISF